MPAIDTAYLATDLAGMIADMPITAKFGSTTFTCSASELTQDETLLLVGNDSESAVRIIFPISAFTPTATFKAQARLQLKFPDASTFTNYEIVSVGTTTDFIAYEVVLKADNRA